MVKLSKGEKKLFNVALIVAAAIVFFLVFIYIPTSRSTAKLKSRVEASEALFSDIKKMIGEYASLEHGIRLLRKQAASFSSKYIEQKNITIALNYLNSAAENAGVRIISISPQSLSVFSGGKGSASLKYYDKACLRQPVKIVLEGRYEQLHDYLSLLDRSAVGIYTINGFSIAKEKGENLNLKMELVIGVYVFGEEKSARKI